MDAGRTQSENVPQRSSNRRRIRLHVVHLHYDTVSWLRAFFAQSRFHFRSIIREAPFLAISVICVINLMVGAWYTAHPGESTIWPVTSAIAPVVANSVFIFVVLLATLYGGELVWRERQLKLDQVQDSIPVPAWVTFGGKLLGVFYAIALLAVDLDGRRHAHASRAGLRAPAADRCICRSLARSRCQRAFAIVALAMGVHAIVNQKFVGHLIIIAYWVVIPVMSNIGFDHRLYQVGRPPDFVFSDMAGWGPYLPRIFTFRRTRLRRVSRLRRWVTSCWCAEPMRWASRRHAAGQRLRHGGAFAVGVFVAAAIGLGGLFFYNANVLNAYTEVHVAERRVKDWEVRYKALASLPQPRLIAVTLRHDFYPERRAAAWNGTLRAVNRNTRAVDTLFVSLPATGATSSESIRGNCRHRTFARFACVRPRRVAHSRRPRERRAAVSICARRSRLEKR